MKHLKNKHQTITATHTFPTLLSQWSRSEVGDVADLLETHPLSMCYHDQFRHSRSNSIGIHIFLEIHQNGPLMYSCQSQSMEPTHINRLPMR